MDIIRRAQGCWTCKKRKIGCDRGSPACNNCLRSGRECLGYGLRLAWPDQPDGRRRLARVPAGDFHHSPTDWDPRVYGRQFLNVTYADLQQALRRQQQEGMGDADALLVRRLLSARPDHAIPLIPGLHERESHLLHYYERNLSGMISTIDVNNGFRDELLPMALSSTGGKDSAGLRNAIFSVAALHLWGPKNALAYKGEAIRSLSSSLLAESVSATAAQLATSMMLCVYNVFDETEGHWHVHLQGARDILTQIASVNGGRVSHRFLYTWFLYHEVLGGFSQPLLNWPIGPVSLRLLRDDDFDRSLIIGSLGCSVEIMEVINYVNHLRALELRQPFSRGRIHSDDGFDAIERRLAALHQHLDASEASQLPTYEQSRTLATAELYKVATCLYLQRARRGSEPPPTAPATSTSAPDNVRTGLLSAAFHILGGLGVCTSPWPLFVVACETSTDAQRIRVLQALDGMDEHRRIGNVFVLRDIIESYWKQQDLEADCGGGGRAASGGRKWWDALDLNEAAPWFI
ncbi:fungal-specific transcription factor domain-containing protein [Xylariaceae sp. FL0804]|nr:fungal-specific transcription factor domain-containing protein [Xylariaceae sp. FL0804]